MGGKVTREEAERGLSCALCGNRLEEGEPVTAERGKTVLGPAWAGRMVVIHDSCLERQG